MQVLLWSGDSTKQAVWEIGANEERGSIVMNSAAYRADATSNIESTGARVHQRLFESLVRNYSTDLYRYAYWLCTDKTLAEDLVQETYVQAWYSLESLRDVDAAKAWLITILRRERARRFDRYWPKEGDVDLDDLEGRDTSYESSTQLALLRRAIAKLPEEYREPLLLQGLGGYSTEEIAELLALSRGAVMTRLFRARQKLCDALDGGF